VVILIASTALYPIFMFRFPWHLGALDTGPVWSGYLGLGLYSAAAVSIGLLMSSLTESQIIAFLITWAALAVLSVLGRFAKVFPPGAGREVLTFISFDARLALFSRGQINTRDIVYFLSITIGCLMAAFRALERRKWA
jgi:ABC-2 type transport system permease protein